MMNTDTTNLIQMNSHAYSSAAFLRPQNHKLSLFTQEAEGYFVVVCSQSKTHLKVHMHLQVCAVSYPSPHPDSMVIGQ